MPETIAFGTEKDKKHYPTIFISDTHLGAKGCRAHELLSFLEAHTCDNLFLVGDIIDGWRLKSNFYWPQEHTNVVRRVFKMAQQGTRVTYVVGNHDEFLRKYVDFRLGNILVTDEAVHTLANGKRLLVVHGDEFDIITRYHRWAAKLGDFAYRSLQQINIFCNRWRERFGYGYWSLSNWAKQHVKTAVSFISNYEEALTYECQRRGFNGIVCGHIHHAEVADYDGIEYFNCGDWVDSCTALVEENGEISILRWGARKAQVTKFDSKFEAKKERIRAPG